MSASKILSLPEFVHHYLVDTKFLIAWDALPEDQKKDPSNNHLKSITICILTLANGHRFVGYNFGALDENKTTRELSEKLSLSMAMQKAMDGLSYSYRNYLAVDQM